MFDCFDGKGEEKEREREKEKTHHERSRTQIGSSQDDHDEAIRKDKSTNGPDQTRSIGLPPGGRVGAECSRTGKCEQTTRRNTAQEDFVQPHVALVHACRRHHLHHLGGRESVDSEGRRHCICSATVGCIYLIYQERSYLERRQYADEPEKGGMTMNAGRGVGKPLYLYPEKGTILEEAQASFHWTKLSSWKTQMSLLNRHSTRFDNGLVDILGASMNCCLAMYVY